jgi:beta-glucanase (GH16 family)
METSRLHYPAVSRRAAQSLAATLLALTATAAAADSYDPATGQLTIPQLQLGAATYTNLVVTIGTVMTPPHGATASGGSDSYDVDNQQLTVPTVTADGATYHNVVATVTGVVSIGAATGVDSYFNSQLTIPALEIPGGASYADVVADVGTLVSVGGGMPRGTEDSYDAAHGQLKIPAVLDEVNGRIYTNVVVTPGAIVSINGSAWNGTPPLAITTGFDANGVATTLSTTAQGAWGTYYGPLGLLTGGSAGGYANQGADPSYEFVYITPTPTQLSDAGYSFQGVSVTPPAGQTISTAGYTGLGFTAQVNPEWLISAGGSANFVVLVTANVGGATGCKAAAVVAATSSAATRYVVPLSAFNVVQSNCGNSSITAAQIIASPITGLDFQADGGGAAIAASGLVSNTNTSVLNQTAGAGQNYPTTLTVFGAINLVHVGAAPPPVIVAAAANGAQNGAVIVTLQDAAQGATIYYTIDGTTPSVASPVYLAPFLVASNLTVKAIAVAPAFGNSAVAARAFTPDIPSGTLVWSEEFTNTSGAPAQPNPLTWTYDTGSSGFGNAELEDYCAWGSSAAPCSAASPNAFVGTDGYLHIVVQQPSPGVYTSARLKSQGLFSFKYGRYEARIAVPEEQGLWPAAWLMGNNIALINWPGCGEMDVQERIDAPLTPDVNFGSVHGPGFTGGAISTTYDFPAGQTAGTFHTYGMIWKPGSVAYYVDDPATPYVTYTSAEVVQGYSGASWPFDAGASFMLLNLAIGGGFPGAPDGTTTFPATMLVDYVRVYTD